MVTVCYNPSELKVCFDEATQLICTGIVPDITYECDATLTVEFANIVNNGTTYCSGYSPPNDYDPTDVNGIHSLAKQPGECRYVKSFDSGGGPGTPTVYWWIEVTIDDTAGYIRVWLGATYSSIVHKAFEHKWNAGVPDGDVGHGGEYSNELTDTDDCHEKGHGGTVTIT